MDRNWVLLHQNIARLRRDVRLQANEIEQLIAAGIDCTSAAIDADAARRMVERKAIPINCVFVEMTGSQGSTHPACQSTIAGRRGVASARRQNAALHISDCFEKCALLISESASNHALFVALPLRLGVSSLVAESVAFPHF
jgi:hypothetical protein